MQLAAASVAVAALTLTAACSSGGDDEKSTDGGEVTIADAQKVGAMENFAVGTAFKATEPTKISLLYRDHPNYPLKKDWLVLQKFSGDNNISFDITSAPLSDWDQKKSLIISSGDARS